jgi:surface polysaccharide O-acyltransferase-like enzyme
MIEAAQPVPNLGAASSRLTVVAAPAPSEAAARLVYLDNLKAALIVCVVVFHVAITYGASGSWYYVEDRGGLPTEALLTVLVAGLQFFFMGLFFAISGYFTPMAYERKGARRFIVDRLKRLGIPLVVFAVVISPVLEGVKSSTEDGDWSEFRHSWLHHLITWTPGPLWFVETLLVFSLVYVAWRVVGAHQPRPGDSALSTGWVLLFMAGLVTVSFLVRLWFPVEAEFQHLQFAFFPQYIAMFVIGGVARERNWLRDLDPTTGRRWLMVGCAGVIAIPVVLILGGAANDGGNLDNFFGGLHWQAAAMAVLEAVILAGMSIGLVAGFRQRFAAPTRLWRVLSRNAYAVYVIHAPIVVALTYACRDVPAPSLLKFVVLAPAAVVASFYVSDRFVMRIPKARGVL